MAVMRLIMIIRAVIMINPKKVEEYFRWSKNRISSADEIAKLTAVKLAVAILAHALSRFSIYLSYVEVLIIICNRIEFNTDLIIY